MKCHVCGKDLPYGTKICDGCGAQLQGNYPNNQYMNYEPLREEKKSVVPIIITFIVIALIVAALIFFLNKDDSKRDEQNTAQDQVNNYILNSRKSAYIDTLVAYCKVIVNEVNAGENFLIFSTDTIYMIPVGIEKGVDGCVFVESGGGSPFTEKWNYIYIGVVYNGLGYKYFAIAEDEKQNGIHFLDFKTLNEEGTELIYLEGNGRDSEISNYLIKQYKIDSNDVHTFNNVDKQIFKDLISQLGKGEFADNSNLNKVIYVSPKVCKSQ